MGTTTFESIRNTQVTQIEGLTPSSMSSVRFHANLAERDFREWAEENPKAAFRRFAISDLFDYAPPEVSNTDVEWIDAFSEVVIAYPETYRYGDDGMRDMRDIMRDDMHDVDNVIGHRGYGNYTDGVVTREGTSHEDLEGVSLLVINYRVRFYRSV